MMENDRSYSLNFNSKIYDPNCNFSYNKTLKLDYENLIKLQKIIKEKKLN